MNQSPRKSLARSVGEFFGHIARAIRTDSGRRDTSTVRRTVDEDDQGDVILRRTTIDEVEIKQTGTNKDRRSQ